MLINLGCHRLDSRSATRAEPKTTQRAFEVRIVAAGTFNNQDPSFAVAHCMSLLANGGLHWSEDVLYSNLEVTRNSHCQVYSFALASQCQLALDSNNIVEI
ncbi:hypothetical protein ABW19_dt0201292 [Dactylella cylindrospora]|nr:hypothetical protein ABW19_dt0201292 [Dactylella cylindrospora]